MEFKSKRIVTDNGNRGDDSVLGTLIGRGDDLGPVVRRAFEAGKPEFLIHQLKNVAKKKEVKIEELCKSHYEEFILAVDELRGVLVDAEELRSDVAGDNLRLQEVGNALLSKIDELLEAYSIKKNVTDAIRMSKICIEVLNLCSKCNRHLASDQFYPALKTADLITKNYLNAIPVKSLKLAIEKTIPAMKLLVEKRVTVQFNEWLVQLRRLARTIGQTAVSHAAASRQREEEFLELQRKAEEGGGSCGVASFSCSLTIDEVDEDFVLDFDLTPLYRAYHIHTCLGIRERFRAYYYENRVLQLNSDLQISSSQPFVESYQPFLAQIAGYFIVEDRVLRTAGGLLVKEQVDMMWETAVTKIASTLREQVSLVGSATHLLLVTDYVAILGSTLARYGYQMGPIFDALNRTREKYHELLLQESKRQISGAIHSDTYEQMVMKGEVEYDNNVLSFHLQASDMSPAFPYIAPFSSMVPDTCRAVRSFIKGSVDYMKHTAALADSFDVAREYLEKLMDVLNGVLLGKIHGGSIGVSQAMQIAANISILENACDFFLRHLSYLCRVPVRSLEASRATLKAKNSLKLTREEAYGTLLHLVNTKLDDFMSLNENINWMSEETPRDVNEHMNEVIIYLETILSTAQQVLPLDALFKLGCGALGHISDAIVSAFLDDNVKRFNANAVLSLDNDLKMLEGFADERFRNTGLSEVYKDRSFRGCLLEARQLINLLLSSQPETFMNPVIREKNYSALDYRKVAAVCEKFKDSSDGIFGSLSSRNTKQSARKKSLDALRRRLKDFG